MPDILEKEQERHIEMLKKLRAFNRKLSLRKLLKREPQLSTVGRFCVVAQSEAVPHDAEKVKERLGYK